MLNFFEQELKKIFADGKILNNPKFTKRACLGGIKNSLDDELIGRAEFVPTDPPNHYTVLRLTVISRKRGKIDECPIRLCDITKVRIPLFLRIIFKKDVFPRIREYNGHADWYIYRPKPADYAAIQKAAAEYFSAFKV